MGETVESLTSLLPATIGFMQLYWSVVLGCIVLILYCKHRFNTPEYAIIELSADQRAPVVTYSALAQMRVPAPPIFTTERWRYRQFETIYLALFLALYLSACFAPDLWGLAHKLQTGESLLSPPQELQERALWALFVLTGVATAVPWLRDLDNWLLRQLHSRAAIPDDARDTALQLFERPYEPNPKIYTDVRATLRSTHMKAVADGLSEGALETRWIKVRCLRQQLREVLSEGKYRRIRQQFRHEFTDLDTRIEEMRQEMFEHLSALDAQVPEPLTDIDHYLESKSAESASQPFLRRRETLKFQTDALFLRMCVFISILVYATERDLDAINERLKALGFQVRIAGLPGKLTVAQAVLTAVAAFAVLFVPSVFYTALAHQFGLGGEAVSGRARLLPTNFGTAAVWSVSGALIHLAALATAMSRKRAYARAQELTALEQNVKAALWALLAGFLVSKLTGIVLFGAPVLRISAWPILAGITGLFAALYIDAVMTQKVPSLGTIFCHGALLSATAFAIAVLTYSEGPNPSEWPLLVLAFALYAAVASSLMGWSIGICFRLFQTRADQRAEASSTKTPGTHLSFAEP